MEDPSNPRILKEDVIRREGFKANSHYDPVHLLQWAHNANLQMSMEFKARRREWEAVLHDGKEGKETPFKRYLHLEHIMEEMQQSERGREYVHLLEQQQKEKDQKKDSD